MMEPSCSLSSLSFGNSDTDISGKLRLIEVLDIRLAEIRDLGVRHNPLTSSSSSSSSSGNDKRIYCVVKLDREEIFRSSAVARTQNPCFGDDFHLEVPKNFTCLSFFVYDQIPNRVARPIGRVTFRKQDLAKYSGLDRWWRLKPMNRHSDVTGKVWLEITRAPSTPTSGNVAIFDTSDPVGIENGMGQSLAVRVLDYCDLNHARSNDLFAVVSLNYPDGTAETKKLRMRRKPPPPPPAGSSQSTTALCSQDAATFTLKPYQTGDIYAENAVPVLRVSVWHDILGSFSSYFHGEVRVPVDASLKSQMGNAEQAFRAWYSLTPRSGNSTINNNNNVNGGQSSTYGSGEVFSAVTTSISSSSSKEGDYLGSLRLKITYSVDHILPMQCYNDLWVHLLDALSVQPFRCSIAGMLAALPRTDLEHVAKPLIRIFLHSDQLRPFIQVLCTEEIAQCQDVNTLFRSSSLASKCIYELMKLVGQQYLVSTLKPVVDKIFADRRSCEIDPSRISPGANIEDNATHLVHYTELALSRICDSSHRCPPLLKDVFRILRETTQRYHQSDPAVQWLVLSSFLIMRFFAAALLNPKLFWLKRENADPTVQRTLALMSKIIQRLCNYVVVGHKLNEKEPFLTPIFERFADESHRLGFTKFFDRVSCAGGENSITGESITVLKEGILIERVPKKKKLQSSYSDQSSSSSTSSASSLCFNFRNVLQRSTSRPRHCCLSETDFSWYKEKGQTLVGRISLADVKVVQIAEELFNNPLVLEICSDRYRVFLEASNKVELGEWIVALQRACKRQRLTQQQLTENAAQMYEIDLSQQLEIIHMIFLENYEVMRAWKDHMAFGNPLPANMASYEGHLANVDSSGRNAFYNSVDQIIECVQSLEQTHIKHCHQIQYGSKEIPIGDDNYLLLGSRMRCDYAAVWAGGGGAGTTSEAYSLAADLEKALEGAAAPPLPPKPATVAVLHYPQATSSSDP